MKTTFKCLAAGLTLAFCNMASAAIIGTLTYLEPTGTVSSTDTIEVWARLTLTEDSDPLFYDRDDIDGNFGWANLPTEGYNTETWEIGTFEYYTWSGLFASRGCSGTFSDGCSDTPYDVSQFESTWFEIDNPFELLPGESADFLLALIIPKDGWAAPGLYTLYNMGLGIFVQGFDGDGNKLEADLVVFNTCLGDLPGCAFTREVVSEVPVPAAAWLFGSGVLGLAGMVRARRQS